jgi:hypothetical protein
VKGSHSSHGIALASDLFAIGLSCWPSEVREQRARTCRSRPASTAAPSTPRHTSFCCAPARPSSSSTLTADLARCEPSKLCSVEPPRSTPIGADARQRPQHAAKCCSAAITRDLPQPPTNTQLLWVGERELVLVVALTRCRPAEHHAQRKLSRTARRRDARRRGQRRRDQQCWSRRFVGWWCWCQLRTREVDD